MASINVRNGRLLIDFRYLGIRCREQTELSDTQVNRRRLTKLIKSIETDIRLGCFVYRDYFPKSKRVSCFNLADSKARIKKDEFGSTFGTVSSQLMGSTAPLFQEFAVEWFEENQIRWKPSYQELIQLILNNYLIPYFGTVTLDTITRPDILKFRAMISKPKQDGKCISADFINHVMTPLRMILIEGSIRFGFHQNFENIKPLRVENPDVHPFSLAEVKYFLHNVRRDFKDYYTTRFFTGMRTSEIDGLRWKNVDFERKAIIVRETLVNGRQETTKTPGSKRDIQMSSLVYDALQAQYQVSSSVSEYVFCTKSGTPLDHRNVRYRIWKPTLERLGLSYRRPYETRHTCATLWLASGEAPEWIAKQMGHTTTKMLFEKYSRYVPNLTRNDGSAFESLISRAF